jgi:hypothetical protein
MTEKKPEYDAERVPARPRGTERKAFVLRLDPELHDELRRWAEQDLRSLNGHIEFLLREALRRRRGGKD